MHAAARDFVQKALQEYGKVTRGVVEFGSQDVNGEIRSLFPAARSYLGIDICSGPGVDIVQDAAEWIPNQAYGCVVTTETFEHTPRWPDMLKVAAAALAPDGIMIVTCASGTRRPHSATRAEKGPAAGEYYANVSEFAFRQAAVAAGLVAEVTTDVVRGDLYAVLRHHPPTASDGLMIIGAGYWRTGTVSLKKALEELTGKSVHHMTEVLHRPDQAARWLAAVKGESLQSQSLLKGYAATLDWPSLAFWEELSIANPEALVLLSSRDAEAWWRSISQTVLLSAPTRETMSTPWDELMVALFERAFVGRSPSKEEAIAAYNRHNDYARMTVPFNKLIDWTPTDGWLPLCRALDVPVPNEPFPHLNTTARYRRNNHLT